jgi:hypothetical protein
LVLVQPAQTFYQPHHSTSQIHEQGKMAQQPNFSHPANRTIDEEIIINAPITKVRNILFDFASYPSWARFVQKIEQQNVEPGTPLAVGQKLSVSMGEAGAAPTVMTMDVAVSFCGRTTYLMVLPNSMHELRCVQVRIGSCGPRYQSLNE